MLVFSTLLRQCLKLYLLPLIFLALWHSPTISEELIGTIKVISDPGDAKVFIDGKYVGKVPEMNWQGLILDSEVGEHLLEIEKYHSKSYDLFASKVIFVAEDTFQPIGLKLKKSPPRKALRKLLAKHPKGYIEPEILPVDENSPAGCLLEIGTGDDQEHNHRVILDSYQIAKFEVTFDEWDLCYISGGCTVFPNDEGWGRGKRPVMNVSWYDAQNYIQWINSVTGKQYRLPTEAEWEYACRSGGKEEKYCGGNSVNSLAWHGKNNGRKSYPRGKKSPNGLGLYDMSGNVSEWVQDWYRTNYYWKSEAMNPQGPKTGAKKVNRGGSWVGHPSLCRSTNRRANEPGARLSTTGFRLALSR